MTIINWIISNVLTQAAVVIGLIALLGLALQKKSVGEVLTGTFSTMLGFLVLSAGSAVVQASLTYFGDVFNFGFGLTGTSGALVASIEGINGQAMNELGLGGSIALTLLGIFIVNLILARVTKFKYVFLTGQALLWMSTLTVVGFFFTGLRGPALVIAASILGGIFATMMPAIAQPIMRKIMGSDDIALGHFCTIGYLVAAGVSKVTGDVDHSTEDVKLPESLSFLSDTYVSVWVVMFIFYLIAAIAGGDAGYQYYLESIGSSSSLHWLVACFLQSLQFVVGLYVLMSGVRLLLANIVPAFQGISMKLVPDARPALDCPVTFAYAPNAVIMGFIFTTIGSIIGMFLTMAIPGLPIVIPGVMSNFFAGGTAGVFCNAVGGRRGTIIGCIAHGIFIMLIPAILGPMLAQVGFVNLTVTDVDTALAGMLAMLPGLFG
ncbi:MAG: PTS transporter subunit IIC [Coriobacteriaceae bacterium]|nr:PTS transporter subunit IIC [Coriobacteriaceae bacterium]